MGWKQDQIDKLLDQFLDGKLTEDEVRLMHEKLESGEFLSDTELDKIVLPDDILISTKQENISFESFESDSSRYKLQDFEKYSTHYKHPIVETSKAHTFVFIIVFFSILIAAPLVYILLPFQFSPQKIFQEYFSPFDITHVNRDFTEDDDFENYSNWQTAISEYQQKNYHDAIHKFDDILTSIPSRKDAYIDYFFIGVSYLAADKTKAKSAIEAFDEVLQGEAPPKWKDRAKWYLALSYLQVDAINTAKEYLQSLIGGEKTAFQYEEAEKLLEEL